MVSRPQRALLVLLTALWAAAFALNVRTYARDIRFPSLYVAAPPSSDGYPRVIGFRAWAHDPASGIAIGECRDWTG